MRRSFVLACLDSRAERVRGTLDGVIVGIGVDVADIGRLEAALARTPGLATRLFAESERNLPLRSLAGCFAAKEADAKALGAPAGLSWTDAVLSRDDDGRPELDVRGTVAAAAARLGVTRWHVSISHDAGICVAMVVAEGCDREPGSLAPDSDSTDAALPAADEAETRRGTQR
jgi:holo-[acyl-carrier protein] synthase